MHESLIRYFEGLMSQAERSTFLRQVEADRDLKHEFAALQNLYAMLQRRHEAGDSVSARMAYMRFVRLRSRRKAFRFARRALAYAASVALIVGATLWLDRQNDKRQYDMASGSQATLELYVPSGQFSRMTLADGSTVWLNSSSTLSYPAAFDGKERRVRLTGEGFFEVAHNPEQPFVVEAGGMNITALGTSFNVEAYPDAVTSVSLLSGSVKLSDSLEHSLILKPNEQAVMADGKLISQKISNPDEFMWRDGIISFSNTTLAEILKTLERYYNASIETQNLAVNDLRFTAKFRRQDELSTVLGVLQLSRGDFRIVRDDNRFILKGEKKVNKNSNNLNRTPM